MCVIKWATLNECVCVAFQRSEIRVSMMWAVRPSCGRDNKPLESFIMTTLWLATSHNLQSWANGHETGRECCTVKKLKFIWKWSRTNWKSKALINKWIQNKINTQPVIQKQLQLFNLCNSYNNVQSTIKKCLYCKKYFFCFLRAKDN